MPERPPKRTKAVRGSAEDLMLQTARIKAREMTEGRRVPSEIVEYLAKLLAAGDSENVERIKRQYNLK